MPAVVAAYITCALIWGTTWYAIRVCIGPGGYPTLVAVALRFVVATLALLPLAVRAGGWPRGRTWWYLVAAGVLDAAAYMLVYLGEERVSGGVAAVVYGTQPLILGVLLSVVRIEKLTSAHVAGAIVSIAGVAVLFLDRLDVSAAQGVGVVLVLGSVILSTTYSVLMKKHGSNVSALVATTVFLAVTAIVLGATALVVRDPIPWPLPVAASVALGYLAIIGSAVAFLVYFWLLGRTSLSVTSTLVFVFPLVALATDAIVAGDSLTPRAYAGAGITLAGLAVSLRRR